MTPDWPLVEPWLAAALARPAAQRADFLERRIVDPQLRARVAALADKASAAEAAGFLEAPAFTAAGAIGAVDERRAVPARIGAYRVVGSLGRGGSSEVVLATREDGVQVAIKVLDGRAEPGSEAFRRFLAERQILGRLEHPRIARLLDGGTTEGGAPYVVMEYVRGAPIDVWCQRRQLGIRDRAALVLEVCAAVRHAHRNLVIHRDLKPSNILVDDTGEPKLLDFGIAKLLESEDGQTTLPWLRALTPNYASPEQLHGGAITTASDVYSLGVLLYYLCCGSLPFPANSPVWRDLDQAAPQPPPPAPSEAARTGLPEACFRGLSRSLWRDLDRVVLTAIERAPERRYGTIDRLAEDLERFVTGRPIRARGAGRLYRLRKLAGRHRAAAVAALVVAVLAAGWTVERTRSRWQLERAWAENDAVAGFLVALFDTAPDDPARAIEVPARTLLDRGLAEVEARQDLRPGVRSSVLAAIGDAYANLGLYAVAAGVLEQAAAWRRLAAGESDPVLAEVLHAWGRALHGASQLPLAEVRYRQALAIRRQRLGARSAAVAETLLALAALERDRGAYGEALEGGRRGLAIRRALWGETHEKTAAAAILVAALHRELGDDDQAATLYRRALPTLRAAGAQGALIDGLSGLSRLLVQQGEAARALPLAEEALALRAERSGTEHPLYFESLQAFAIAAYEAGEVGRAEAALRAARDMAGEAFGPHHHQRARASMNLGNLLLESGRFAEAEPLLAEAVEVGGAVVGRQHPKVAAAAASLAIARCRLGRVAEAVAMFGSAAQILDASLGPQHPDTSYLRASFERALAGVPEPAKLPARASDGR